MAKVVIYTDGACSGNPGRGGWGAVILCEIPGANGRTETVKKTISGGEEMTTNNRMELTAILEALKTVIRPCEIEIFTDSKYAMDGATVWRKKWEKNKWRNSEHKPVANQDLWQQILPLVDKHDIIWHWVKGHADNELNNEADRLARAECGTL